MMLEEAIVEKILEKRQNSEIILLKKVRPDACHDCNAKILCGVKSNFFFKAINQSSTTLQKGDCVEYQLPDISVIKLSFLLYSVPLMVFLLSLLTLLWVFPDREYFSVFVSLVMMLLSFFFIGWYDRKNFIIGERRLPKIQQKIL